MLRLSIITNRELKKLARSRFLHFFRYGGFIPALVLFFMESWMAGFKFGDVDGQRLLKLTGITYTVWAWISGGMAVADSISSEKRSGTLGLLLLSPLKSIEILMGKWLSATLKYSLGLLGLIPLLMMLLVAGGISVMDIVVTVLIIWVCFLFSSAIGLWISMMSVQSRTSYVVTLISLVGMGCALPLVGNILPIRFAGFSDGYLSKLWIAPWMAWDFLSQSSWQMFRNPNNGNNPVWIPTLRILFSMVAIYGILSLSILGVSSLFLRSVWIRHCNRTTVNISLVQNILKWKEVLIAPLHKVLMKRAWTTFPISDGMNPVQCFWAFHSKLSARLLTLFALIHGGVFAVILILWISVIFNEVRELYELPILWGGFVVTFLFDYGFKFFTSLELCGKIMEDRKSGGLEMILTTPMQDTTISSGILKGLKQATLRHQTATCILYTSIGLVAYSVILLRSEKYPYSYQFQVESATMLASLSWIMAISSYLTWLSLIPMGCALSLKRSNLLASALQTWLQICVLPGLAQIGSFVLVTYIYYGVLQVSGVNIVWMPWIGMAMYIPPLAVTQMWSFQLSTQKMSEFEFFRRALTRSIKSGS